MKQIGALQRLVATLPAPVDEAAAAFRKADPRLVRRHLETLVLVGEVREDSSGQPYYSSLCGCDPDLTS